MAITRGKRACPVCGAQLPDDCALCPVCAMRGALETQSDSASDISAELCFDQCSEDLPFYSWLVVLHQKSALRPFSVPVLSGTPSQVVG